ncbi:hypothetical protein M0802_009215 [Mischocyttarus mexicanus]|nr:hypothetical protein M0802_009215 [Mischocyttarus mexicanus]
MWGENDDMQEIDLSKDQLKHLKMAFDTFDPEKKGAIQTSMVGTILEMLGHEIRGVNLQEMISTYDLWGTGELKFEDFTKLASRFMEEDTDTEAMKEELREAFRIYDKEGNGYITTDVFRDILHELDDQLSPEELDMIIEEVDTDGSGTLDFEGEKTWIFYLTIGCMLRIHGGHDGINDELLARISNIYQCGREDKKHLVTCTDRNMPALSSISRGRCVNVNVDVDVNVNVDVDVNVNVDEDLSIVKRVKAFDAFDHEKKGCIGTDMVGTILTMLGYELSEKTLHEIIKEVDEDGSGELEFEEFCTLAARFLVEEDTEAMQQELREAFRLYDKEGNGYITTAVFRDILHELDDKLTNEELDLMIEEIDADGSGTLDFDGNINMFYGNEFMEVMTGGDD